MLDNNGSLTKEQDGVHDRLQESVLEELLETLRPSGPLGRLWLLTLGTVMFAGAAAYAWQLLNGLRVTGMREYVSWGAYMTNFVFFIGVSHAGTLISAILRVTQADWRRSITRMAEGITVFALMVGAPMVIIDMGRPDRVLNVILHGRFNSPILWDVCAICTYLSGSLLYLYVAMIPDLAMLAPKRAAWDRAPWKERIYLALSLGYQGTAEQRRLLERALATMSIIIIPVAISVHTVVSWIFGMTLRPGWHSTIFGPYFVIGAIFSGTAAIITAMVLFRKAYHLEKYLTYRQFQNLGRLMLALNLLYIYFTLSEYLTAWYGSEVVERRLIDLLMGRNLYGLMFWGWAVFCLFLPALIVGLPRPKTLIPRLVIASILINIGMWVKRYLIIVPTLMTPYINPEAAGAIPHYYPTWVEWTVTAGGLATFMMLFTLFAKFFPIISIWETVEGVEELGAERIGVEVTIPKAKPRRRFQTAPAFLALPLLLAALVGIGAATRQASPSFTLTARGEGEDKEVVASLRVNTNSLAGARVAFFVERAFGRLPIGATVTDDKGVAAISFPESVPGATNGVLKVLAEVTAPPEWAGAQAKAEFAATLPRNLVEEPFPRALWSPHAPFPLVLTLLGLLTIVWSTYSFVIVQLVKLRRAAKTM